MALDRLKSVAQHVAGTGPPPHPFDPLSNAEIEKAVSIISSAHGKLFYNAVTLREPPKKQMLKWLENSSSTPRPTRVADVVALAPGGAVFDGLVDLESGKITKWEKLEGVQPLVSTFKGHRSILLIKSDHHGRSPDRGTCLQERPQSY